MTRKAVALLTALALGYLVAAVVADAQLLELTLTGCMSCKAGDTLRVGLTAQNLGPAFNAALYIGVSCLMGGHCFSSRAAPRSMGW